jgi:prevent-host-death family protein
MLVGDQLGLTGCGNGAIEPAHSSRYRLRGGSGYPGRRPTVGYMETTAQEFNRHASKFLAAAEHGERITVTKNGRPIAILSPVADKDAPVPPYPTDPMGEDPHAPVFHSKSPVDQSEPFVTDEETYDLDGPVTIEDIRPLRHLTHHRPTRK